MWYIIYLLEKIVKGDGSMSKKYKALDVALLVINYCHDQGFPISNLQLQKILYYIQGAFLVQFDRECFGDDIVNWTYGPVVEEVYQEFKEYGCSVIPRDIGYVNVYYDEKTNLINHEEKKVDIQLFNEEDIILIEKVASSYMKMQPFDLVEKTHSEDPWRYTCKNMIITKESIKKYFKKNPDRILGE